MILAPTQAALLVIADEAAQAAGRYASAWNLYQAELRRRGEAPPRVVQELNSAAEALTYAMDALRSQQAVHLRTMAAFAREQDGEAEAPEGDVVTLRAAS